MALVPKIFWNRVPNIKVRQCDLNREGRKQLYNPDISQERFRTIERLLHGKTSSSVYYFGLNTRIKTFMDSKYLLIPLLI